MPEKKEGALRLSYHQVQMWGTGRGWRDEGLKLSVVNIRKESDTLSLVCGVRSLEAKKLKSNKFIRELMSWGEPLTPKLERNIKKQPFQNMPRIYVEKCVILIYIEGN